MPHTSDSTPNNPIGWDWGERPSCQSRALSYAELEVRQLFDGVFMGTVDTVSIDESLEILNDLANSDQDANDSISNDGGIGANDVDDLDNDPEVDDDPLPIQTSSQSVSFIPGGGYVLTWSQQNDGSANWDVYAQVFGSDGAPAGQAFRVNQFTTGDQQWASVSTGPQGDFMVTWSSQAQDGNGWGVYARSFDAHGTALGDEIRVNSYINGDQYLSSVEFDGAGGFVIIWHGQGRGDPYGIFGQRYASDGTPIGSEFRVNSNAAGSQTNATLSVNESGKFVVGWIDNQQFHYQLFNEHGSKIGNAGQISGASQANSIDLWLSDDGRMVVAWTEPLEGAQASYYQVYDTDHTLLVSKTALEPLGVFQSVRTPSITGDAGGNFLISWHGSGPSITDGVYVSVFDEAGQALKSPVFVAGQVSPHLGPSIAMLNVDDFVVAWNTTDEALSAPGHRLFLTNFQFTAPGTSVGPVIDGIIDSQWDSTPVQLIGHQVTPAAQYAGFHAGFSAKWDTSNLYVLLRVADDQFTGLEGVHGKVDGLFSLYIDGNLSRGFEFVDGQDLQLVFRATDSSVWSVSSQGVWSQVDATFSIREVNGGYIVEGAIPWTVIGTTPSTGEAIGLDWQVHRFDLDGQISATLAWSATVSPSHLQPELWGTVSLGPRPAMTPMLTGPVPVTPVAPAETNHSEPVIAPVTESMGVETTQVSNGESATDGPLPLASTSSTSIRTQPAPEQTTTPAVETTESPVETARTSPATSSESGRESVTEVQEDVTANSSASAAIVPENMPHDDRQEDEPTALLAVVANESEGIFGLGNYDGFQCESTNAIQMEATYYQIARHHPQMLAGSTQALTSHSPLTWNPSKSPTVLSFKAVADQEAQRVATSHGQLQLSSGVMLAAGVTSMMTIGYLTWIVRGSILVAGMMSAAPLWQSFDPLPVLKNPQVGVEDGESLESMVNQGAECGV